MMPAPPTPAPPPTPVYDPVAPLLSTGSPELKLRHGWALRPPKLPADLEALKTMSGSPTADAVLRTLHMFGVPRPQLNNSAPRPAWASQNPNISPWHLALESAPPRQGPHGLAALLQAMQQQQAAGLLPFSPLTPYL